MYYIIIIKYYYRLLPYVVVLTDLLGKECWAEELQILLRITVTRCLGDVAMGTNIGWHERTIAVQCRIVLGFGQLLRKFQRHSSSSVTISIRIPSTHQLFSMFKDIFKIDNRLFFITLNSKQTTPPDLISYMC